MTEAELLDTLRQAARMSGWLTYHALRSEGSEPGLPDLIMVRDGRLLLWELKSATGRVSKEQQKWLDRLAVVDRIDVNIVRPDDLTEALDRLNRTDKRERQAAQ